MDELITVIASRIKLSSLDKNYIHSLGKSMHYKKKEILLTEGQIADKLFFIRKGVLRSYSISNTGEDLTSEIISPLHFFTNFESFGRNSPSNLYIETITDCELIELSKKEYLSLFTTITDWFVFCNFINEEYVKKNIKRITTLKDLSAKERYNNFVFENPDIANTIPIKHLASYLGMKPQSLSRIRKHNI